MVLIESAYSFDFWLKEPITNKIELTCCLPNSIVIMLESHIYASLLEVKMDLMDEAEKYPLAYMLRDGSTYMFSCVSVMGEWQDLRDETRRICDVKPFGAVLRLINFTEIEDTEKEINCQISSLIGKGVHDFSTLNSPEVNEFRLKMKIMGLEIARNRQRKSWRERLAYHYPPRFTADDAVPQNCLARLQDKSFFIIARIQKTPISFKLNILCTETPKDVIIRVLAKKAINFESPGKQPEDFVLKVCGKEEYLMGKMPILNFFYVQECLLRDVLPALVLTSVESVPVALDNIYSTIDPEPNFPHPDSYSTLTLRKQKAKSISSWCIDDLFSIHVGTILRLNTDVNRTVDVGVQAGIFHGGKPLCETRKTSERAVRDGTADLNEELEFDLRICNIPRNARICFAVYEVSKTSKGVKSKKLKESKQEMFQNPLAWVNAAVYDFKNQLKFGTVTLNLWTYSEDSPNDEILQSLATVVSNNALSHATALTLTFKKYDQEALVLYPAMETMISYAKSHPDESDTTRTVSEVKAYLESMRQQAESDPLHDMHEQDMKKLWSMRYHAHKYVPAILPKLLDSVEWNDHKQCVHSRVFGFVAVKLRCSEVTLSCPCLNEPLDKTVAEAMNLLAQWPLLPVEKALELLDYAYADQHVRSFAVRCLVAVPGERLSLYLLQLVQAIKHENYLTCDLVEFLLRLALDNRKIGHYLFWHLRSEMSFTYVSDRFGLILEAYCRGSLEHIDPLLRQLNYLRIMTDLTETLRLRKDRDKARLYLQETLSDPRFSSSFADVINPLDPSYHLKSVRVDKCRVMDSKMRPLYIVMENNDPLGEDVYVIFKNGDDLRQDMLALQMIKIMDMLWKNEGLDLRMNPYECISTDHKVGMIEVVLNAETIANIQKEKGMFTATSAFNKGAILAWLKDFNQEENQLLKAIEEFTLSCAGYCVATYVLGVADRHSDNIMVKRSGQLFHIDFGHILGHFKEKFGFRRERVPFVLTHDFVHVINKGQKDKKEALEFRVFQTHCEKAFLILRRHGGLILSLFAMMISTGLPELSSEADLNYLRETLVLEKTELEALAHFRSKFYEALANSWKTSLNWASHNLAKNNKA